MKYFENVPNRMTENLMPKENKALFITHLHFIFFNVLSIYTHVALRIQPHIFALIGSIY